MLVINVKTPGNEFSRRMFGMKNELNVKHSLIRCTFLSLYLVLGSPVSVYAGKDSISPTVDFEFDDPPPTVNRISDSLSWGAEVRLDLERFDNLDLDDSDDDQITVLEPLVRTALSYIPNASFRGFLDLELSSEQVVSQGDDLNEDDETHLRLREAYLLFPELSDTFSLQLGRQRFSDSRTWWYDARIDSARLYYRSGRYGAQISAGQRIFVGDDFLADNSEDNTNYFIFTGRYAISDKADIRPYLLIRNSRADDGDEDPVFLGIQSAGKLSSDMKYWVNAAYVGGNDGDNDIRAWGLDLGASYRFDVAWKPAITLAVAYGSGDSDPDDGVDRNFRQTGLEENKAKNFGVTRFRYYGEVLDPELSNMQILTAGLGVRPTRKSSIDLVYYYSRQDVASDTLRDTDLDEDPAGVDRTLGDELDLIIGYRGIKNMKLRLILGAFIPGSAFERHTDTALLAKFRIAYRF